MKTNSAQQRPRRVTARIGRPVMTALALAASAACHAQFFSSTGDVSSSPVNIFPINPAVSTYNLVGSSVSVGGSASGSLFGAGGGVLLADALSLGNSGTGSGSVTLAGTGTRITLGGTSTTGFNRLEVGNWGIGSLSVSSGAVVDASAACAGGQRCNAFIGNAAGSSGVLNIDGALSTVSTIGFTGIGTTAVFTLANDGFNFGTPGGLTNGAVNITAGGTLNTQQTTVGSGPTNPPSSLGTELGIGSVVVDGAGSRWVATRDTVNNNNAFVGVGSGVGGQGTVIVRNGGHMLVDGTGGSNTGFDTLHIGVNGGQGALTVTGSGSSLAISGNNPNLAVGRSGAAGQGTLEVLAGATASSLFLNVGRDGANGAVTIDGLGSQLSLLGVSTPGIVGGGSAFATIGRDGGTGSFGVSNGGRLFISDNGGDSRAAPGTPGFIVGRGVGATGTMTISGPDSIVEVSSTSRGVPVGTADNFNPFVGIGQDNVGSLPAQLQINNGGRLVLNGNGVSNPTFGSATQLAIGGRSGGSGTGTVTVTGAGSAIEINGFDRFISVGRSAGSNGTLNVLNNASVSTTNILVGENANGTLNIDNALVAMSGFRTDSSNVGAGMTVGRGAGSNATLTMSNGARITIENNTLVGGFSIGGDSFVTGGSGSVSLSGGSSIAFSGSVADRSLNVGRTGSGSLSLTGGSTVDVGSTGSVLVGRLAGSSGTLDVNSGSRLLAGQIAIGGASDVVAGGVGTATVSGLNSELRASGPVAYISVGQGGAGTFVVSDQAQVNATALGVGRASGGVGAMTVNNGSITLSGQETAAPFAGANLGIGVDGGSGSVTLLNGSTVAITNAGSAGASLNVGGSPLRPLGTGTLNVTDSTVNVTAAPGLATVRIGHDGTGTATFTSSLLNLSNGSTRDGSVIIAGLPGSVGTLVLNAGSVVNASYVGVGSTQNPAFDPITNPTQNPGGTGWLVLNDSTINTDVFEIGALGRLSGNNGEIFATGNVIVGGIIDPGNSAGRIRINCNLITLPGSQLILEIQSDGAGGFLTDRLVIDTNSTFDLSQFDIVFRFLGDTDVNAFASTAGAFDLDNFLRTGVGTDETQGLSTEFASGQTWSTMVAASHISFQSDFFDVSSFSLGSDGSVTVTAARIPEPATWLLMLIGLAAVQARLRRRH